MQDFNEICKAIAEVLPWEIQSALLAIRDDGLTADKIPNGIFINMNELQLIETDGQNRDNIRLSKLGRNIVDHCSC